MDTVFVVWKGHRDYEEDVAACETQERAEALLRENNVEMRRIPGYLETAPLDLMDEDCVPWGIIEIPFLGAS